MSMCTNFALNNAKFFILQTCKLLENHEITILFQPKKYSGSQNESILTTGRHFLLFLAITMQNS